MISFTLILCTTAAPKPADDLSALSVSYKAAISGVKDKKIKALLADNAHTFKLIKRPPATTAQLRLRAERDAEFMHTTLKSLGYYACRVTVDMDTSRKPVQVRFVVETGELYRLGKLAIDYVDVGPDMPTPQQLQSRLKPGQAALAKDILDEEARLIALLADSGYPFAKVTRRRNEINHDLHTVDIDMQISPGARAMFGRMTFDGLSSVSEAHVEKFITWENGDIYNESLVSEFEMQLLMSGLFSIVRVAHSNTLDAAGELPVVVKLSERKPRTVRLGLQYRSDTGFGGKAFWEHRNFFGNGEALELSTLLAETEYELRAAIMKPHFRRRNQSLILALDAGEDSPDAYTSLATSATAGLKRRLSVPGMSTEVGIRFKYAEVEQLGITSIDHLLSFPLSLEWDRRDDALDSHRGTRLWLELEPYINTTDPDITFTRTTLNAATYLSLTRTDRMVLALRGVLGSMLGEDNLVIPADERFYAGGGGSVRGYKYQTAGDIVEGTPIGGRSLLEVSAELRLKLSRLLGIVAFADGGRAFADTLADTSEDLLWGAGLGLRLFTGVGPIRFDGAIPLDRRDGIDDSFQFYVGLGQAF